MRAFQKGMAAEVSGFRVDGIVGPQTWQALVSEALSAERLMLEDALERYRLTSEEFLAWQRSIDRHGLAGLRTTRIQQYR